MSPLEFSLALRARGRRPNKTCGIYFVCIAGYAGSVHHNAIDCPRTRVVSEIHMHVGTGPDCGLDSFPFAVEHMSGTVENVTARTLVVNNERLRRLIACRLASFNCHDGARSRHCDQSSTQSGRLADEGLTED